MKVKKLIKIDDNLHEDMIVKGTVKGIQPYGAFVEIEGGAVGLLHIEDISVARIKSPYERFNIGQEINVKVKSIDREQNRVMFSYKDLLGTWKTMQNFLVKEQK